MATRYSECVKLDESNPTYYLNRCAALMMSGDFQAAIQDARKALTLDPNSVKALFRMSKWFAGFLTYLQLYESG